MLEQTHTLPTSCTHKMIHIMLPNISITTRPQTKPSRQHKSSITSNQHIISPHTSLHVITYPHISSPYTSPLYRNPHHTPASHLTTHQSLTPLHTSASRDTMSPHNNSSCHHTRAARFTAHQYIMAPHNNRSCHHTSSHSCQHTSPHVTTSQSVRERLTSASGHHTKAPLVITQQHLTSEQTQQTTYVTTKARISPHQPGRHHTLVTKATAHQRVTPPHNLSLSHPTAAPHLPRHQHLMSHHTSPLPHHTTVHVACAHQGIPSVHVTTKQHLTSPHSSTHLSLQTVNTSASPHQTPALHVTTHHILITLD